MIPSLILRNTARAAASANPGRKALDAGAKRDPELYVCAPRSLIVTRLSRQLQKEEGQ